MDAVFVSFWFNLMKRSLLVCRTRPRNRVIGKSIETLLNKSMDREESHRLPYCYSCSLIKNKSSVRESSQRALSCISRLTNRHSGRASGLMAKARFNRLLNSTTFCSCTHTDRANATRGPACCQLDNSMARWKCFRARSIAPRTPAGLLISKVIRKE